MSVFYIRLPTLSFFFFSFSVLALAGDIESVPLLENLLGQTYLWTFKNQR